ncbi:MAG: LysM peptidoglycan-binding domain-containing protein [Chloroflexi bacterium]|nr:LysM peptidoglycan-binding domain-containing protein [Chloroflexota bacterium]
MKRPESSIVLLMIMMAIVLAIGVFLVVSIVLERPDLDTAVQDPIHTVTINGETITLQIDPNQRPEIVAETPPPPEAAPAEEQATEPTPEPTPQAEEAAPQAQPATAQDSTGGQPANHLIFIGYTVKQGDTLYRIQVEQLTSIALMAKHDISASDIIVGNVLSLPVGDSASCGDWQAYVVIQGDTPFGLAQRFNTTLADLQARNNLDANYSIYETQVICVP